MTIARKHSLTHEFPMQVVCTAHSKLTVDGKPLGEGKEFIAVIAKDGKQKGFFIRLVDKEVSLHTCTQ